MNFRGGCQLFHKAFSNFLLSLVILHVRLHSLGPKTLPVSFHINFNIFIITVPVPVIVAAAEIIIVEQMLSRHLWLVFWLEVGYGHFMFAWFIYELRHQTHFHYRFQYTLRRHMAVVSACLPDCGESYLAKIKVNGTQTDAIFLSPESKDKDSYGKLNWRGLVTALDTALINAVMALVKTFAIIQRMFIGMVLRYICRLIVT